MAQLNFDATQIAPDAGQLDAIPAGWYNAAMDQSEMKPTKDGSGAYLECRFNVLDGQFAGRKLFARLNLRNANPVAQEIAFKQLSAICHAVGVLNVQESSQLHNQPLKLKVSLRPASGDYEASNEIKAFKNINENVGGVQNGAPASGPASFTPPPQQAAPQQQAQAQGFPQAGAPAQQPWQGQPQQAAQAAPATAQPWQQAPQQQPAQQQPAQQQPAQQPAEQAWQQPQAQQPWQAAPQQQAQAQGFPQAGAPAQQQAPMTQQPAHVAAPEGFNPQSATPPWHQPQQ